MRLTLLSPAIIEMILNGKLARNVQLEVFLRPFGIEWADQREWFL